MKASRLTGGAEKKVKADKMGGPTVPKRESSIENRKSEHKLANLEMNTQNRDPMEGAIGRVSQLVRQRKRGSFE